MPSKRSAPEPEPKRDAKEPVNQGAKGRTEKEAELEAAMKRGREKFESILKTLGFKSSAYPPNVLGGMVAFDPNLLSEVRMEGRSPKDIGDFLHILGSFVGKTSYTGQIDLGGGDMLPTRLYVGPLTRLRSLLRACQEKILFSEKPFRSLRELDRLRVFALADAIENDELKGVAWVQRCREMGMRDTVDNAIKLLLSESPLLLLEPRFRHLFPWFFDESAKAEPSANDYEQQMEKADHDALRASGSDDASGSIDDEEDPINDYEDTIRPLLKIYEGSENLEYTGKPTPLGGGMEQALAVVRFVGKHPDAVSASLTEDVRVRAPYDRFKKLPQRCRAFLPAIVAEVLATVEFHPMEDIPSEILEFLKEQLSSPAITSAPQIAIPWPIFGGKSNDGDSAEDRLKAYLYSNAELHDVASALPKNVDVKTMMGLTQSARRRLETFTPLFVKTMSAWVRTNGVERVKTGGDLADAMKACERAMTEHLKKNNLMLKSSESTSLDAHRLWDILWFLCQKNMAIPDAIAVMEKHYVTIAQEQRASALEVLTLRGNVTPDTGWELWNALRKDSVLISCYQAYLPFFRKAFASDPARAVTLICSDIIDPTMEKIRSEDHNDTLIKNVLHALNTIASMDADEAKGILGTLLRDTAFRKHLGNFVKRSGIGHEDFDSTSLENRTTRLGLLAQLCYSDIVYPRKGPVDYTRHLEGTKHALPPAIAWGLEQESKQNILWSACVVPILGNQEAWVDQWYSILASANFPEPPKTPDYPDASGYRKGASGSSEHMGTHGGKEGVGQFHSPTLPSVRDVSKDAKDVGVLSEPLKGDASYLTMFISDHFDPAWISHLPQGREQNMALRPLLHRPREKGTPVTLSIDIAPHDPVPVSIGSEIASVELDRGTARWASHWSKRIDSSESVKATIEYRTGRDEQPGDQTLNELLATLPESLKERLGKPADLKQLPLEFQKVLKAIDMERTPLRDAVKQVTDFVQGSYAYEFILENPVYKERYEALMAGMPYTSDGPNRYLDFIHSLREEDDDVLGRGICGQLATVLQYALRCLGIPAYYAAGYQTDPESTTVSTKDAHAWVNVPFLNEKGELFFKPVEATGGHASRSSVAQKSKVKKQEDSTKGTVAMRPKRTAADIQEDLASLHSNIAASFPGRDDVTADDVWMADALIHAAASGDDAPSKETLIKRLQRRDVLLPPGAFDRWDTHGMLFAPRIRKRLEILSAEVSDVLTPAASAIVQHLIERSHEAYEAWRARAEHSTDVEDPGNWGVAPKKRGSDTKKNH